MIEFSSILLFDIGFLPVSFFDLLDILIVGYLIFQIYKLLKGGLAFNIFTAVVLLFAAWGIFNALGMVLMSRILDAVTSIGLVALLIVFQPEVRRFLIFLGKSTLKQRFKFLVGHSWGSEQERKDQISSIIKAVESFNASKTGALIIYTDNPNIGEFSGSGINIDADVTTALLITIFNKESPLHDGAVIITQGRIYSAGCILPISDSQDLPTSAGLRHRAAVGVTESTDVLAIIVSEETGKISYAQYGKLTLGVSSQDLHKMLNKVSEKIYEND